MGILHRTCSQQSRAEKQPHKHNIQRVKNQHMQALTLIQYALMPLSCTCSLHTRHCHTLFQSELNLTRALSLSVSLSASHLFFACWITKKWLSLCVRVCVCVHACAGFLIGIGEKSKHISIPIQLVFNFWRCRCRRRCFCLHTRRAAVVDERR